MTAFSRNILSALLVQPAKMTDLSVDKDELVLLSMVWCDALKIDIGEAGVLVKPDDVKQFLQKAFVSERGKWHGERRAICAEFGVPEVHEDPYKSLISTRGPAFMSIRKVRLLPWSNPFTRGLNALWLQVCDPAGDEDLRVSIQNPQETKDYTGFKTYRATKVTVTSKVDLKQVVGYVYASLKAAMEQKTKEMEDGPKKNKQEGN